MEQVEFCVSLDRVLGEENVVGDVNGPAPGCSSEMVALALALAFDASTLSRVL